MAQVSCAAKILWGLSQNINNSCFKNDTTIAPSVLSHSNQKDLEVAATQIFKNGKSNANCHTHPTILAGC